MIARACRGSRSLKGKVLLAMHRIVENHIYTVYIRYLAGKFSNIRPNRFWPTLAMHGLSCCRVQVLN